MHFEIIVSPVVLHCEREEIERLVGMIEVKARWVILCGSIERE